MDDGAYEIVDSEPFRAQMRRAAGGSPGFLTLDFGTPLGEGAKNQQRRHGLRHLQVT